LQHWAKNGNKINRLGGWIGGRKKYEEWREPEATILLLSFFLSIFPCTVDFIHAAWLENS